MFPLRYFINSLQVFIYEENEAKQFSNWPRQCLPIIFILFRRFEKAGSCTNTMARVLSTSFDVSNDRKVQLKSKAVQQSKEDNSKVKLNDMVQSNASYQSRLSLFDVFHEKLLEKSNVTLKDGNNNLPGNDTSRTAKNINRGSNSRKNQTSDSVAWNSNNNHYSITNVSEHCTQEAFVNGVQTVGLAAVKNQFSSTGKVEKNIVHSSVVGSKLQTPNTQSKVHSEVPDECTKSCHQTRSSQKTTEIDNSETDMPQVLLLKGQHTFVASITKQLSLDLNSIAELLRTTKPEGSNDYEIAALHNLKELNILFTDLTPICLRYKQVCSQVVAKKASCELTVPQLMDQEKRLHQCCESLSQAFGELKKPAELDRRRQLVISFLLCQKSSLVKCLDELKAVLIDVISISNRNEIPGSWVLPQRSKSLSPSEFNSSKDGTTTNSLNSQGLRNVISPDFKRSKLSKQDSNWSMQKTNIEKHRVNLSFSTPTNEKRPELLELASPLSPQNNKEINSNQSLKKPVNIKEESINLNNSTSVDDNSIQVSQESAKYISIKLEDGNIGRVLVPDSTRTILVTSQSQMRNNETSNFQNSCSDTNVCAVMLDRSHMQNNVCNSVNNQEYFMQNLKNPESQDVNKDPPILTPQKTFRIGVTQGIVKLEEPPIIESCVQMKSSLDIHQLPTGQGQGEENSIKVHSSLNAQHETCGLLHQPVMMVQQQYHSPIQHSDFFSHCNSHNEDIHHGNFIRVIGEVLNIQTNTEDNADMSEHSVQSDNENSKMPLYVYHDPNIKVKIENVSLETELSGICEVQPLNELPISTRALQNVVEDGTRGEKLDTVENSNSPTDFFPSYDVSGIHIVKIEPIDDFDPDSVCSFNRNSSNFVAVNENFQTSYSETTTNNAASEEISKNVTNDNGVAENSQNQEKLSDVPCQRYESNSSSKLTLNEIPVPEIVSDKNYSKHAPKKRQRWSCLPNTKAAKELKKSIKHVAEFLSSPQSGQIVHEKISKDVNNHGTQTDTYSDKRMTESSLELLRTCYSTGSSSRDPSPSTSISDQEQSNVMTSAAKADVNRLANPLSPVNKNLPKNPNKEPDVDKMSTSSKERSVCRNSSKDRNNERHQAQPSCLINSKQQQIQAVSSQSLTTKSALQIRRAMRNTRCQSIGGWSRYVNTLNTKKNVKSVVRLVKKPVETTVFSPRHSAGEPSKDRSRSRNVSEDKRSSERCKTRYYNQYRSHDDSSHRYRERKGSACSSRHSKESSVTRYGSSDRSYNSVVPNLFCSRAIYFFWRA